MFMIIYCMVAMILQFTVFKEYGVEVAYVSLIILGVIKGISSKKLTNVFNIGKLKKITWLEVVDLIGVFILGFLAISDELSEIKIYEYAFLIILGIIVYRFLVLGISRQVQKGESILKI